MLEFKDETDSLFIKAKDKLFEDKKIKELLTSTEKTIDEKIEGFINLKLQSIKNILDNA